MSTEQDTQFEKIDLELIKYTETIKKAAEQYDDILNKFYGQVKQFRGAGEWEFNSNPKSYLQIYKPEWKGYGIHYELLAADDGKYYLSENSNFCIVLHVEINGAERRNEIRNKLRKLNVKFSENEKFKKFEKNFANENVLDNTSVFSFEFENQNFAKNSEDIIETIKELFELICESEYTEKITEIIKDQKQAEEN